MLNADRAVRMTCCPRCGVGGFERLKTHSYCVDCNYSETHELDEALAIPQWVLDYLKRPNRKDEGDNHSDEKLVGLTYAKEVIGF